MCSGCLPDLPSASSVEAGGQLVMVVAAGETALEIVAARNVRGRVRSCDMWPLDISRTTRVLTAWLPL